MTRAWQTIAREQTNEGPLELRRRGEGDFLITIAGRVLMNSRNHRSERVLGERATALLAGRERPRVLVGGLGMAYTLRAVLDGLPAGGDVVVAEWNRCVVDWCRGPLSCLTSGAVSHPDVRVEVADVAGIIRRAAAGGGAARFDAIVLDLSEGPHGASQAADDPFYGTTALAATRDALRPDGVLAVWGEAVDAGFQQRLRNAGFRASRSRPGKGGLRHVVYIARSARR